MINIVQQGEKKLREQINWQSFASRHDMKWSKKSCSWDSGAFLGNGLLGIMIYSAEDKTRRNTLRCVVGRTDVEVGASGRPQVSTRVPLGELDLELEGWISDGTSMELDLYQAEFRATLMTTKGRARVRSLVHSVDPVVFLEIETAEGERAEFHWAAYPEIPLITKNEDGVNYNQYIPEIRLEEKSVDGIAVQVQRFSECGGCIVAYYPISEKNGKAGIYLTIQNGFGEQEEKAAVEIIKKSASLPVEQWQQSHRNWWSEYYKKSFVSIPDTRLEGFYLIQLYKMASATRPDYPLMDNQGPWMAATPWPRAWFNMNVQMAYSPVYTSNHLEIGESLCRSLDDHMDSLIGNVAEEYQTDSAGLGRSAGCNLVSEVKDEVGNLTWVLHNYWRQYRYSMDDDRLREHLFPLLKRSIQYYIHLLEEGEDGRLHLPEMISPEYGSFRHLMAEDTTYDLALLRWGLITLLKTCERLKLEDKNRRVWRRVLTRLSDYHQDDSGLMIGKDVPLAFGHRHFSHLLPVFPLHLIGGDTEEEKALIHRCLRNWFHREGDLRGFTFSGAASIAAAIGEGDEALAYVKSALHLFKPNTMYAEAGPVIESPLALAEGINDMLLQSWGDDIRVFPAVPKEWKDVTFHNLRTEGAFLISAVKRDGETKWIRVESLAGEPCLLKTDWNCAVHMFPQGDAGMQKEEGGIIRLNLKKGEETFLYAGDRRPDFVIEPVEPQEHLKNYFGEYKPWRLYGIPFSD